ncbi:carbohydrate-binding module family 5 protein [Calocera viscosa TUFC12733]|uniref:chitinase n=1 Tax=Calocera viscosa (strain TUFC12733) TaxID=1330018 RepID=A0A167IPI8_CALVF|nr:carbohydrate-binding module family 5 protein [Calocera viscosa TUFC12733]
MAYHATNLVFALAGLLAAVAAFDNTCNDNLAVYWGQNSYGAANAGQTAGYQQPINYYCQDDTIDVIPVAFVDVFYGTGGLPELNLANTCSSVTQPVFNGTGLANCQFLASDIEACQAAGKIVTISLGGAGGSVGFSSDTDGQQFADTIWNLFLGGTSDTRPFGDAVLDGVDLDIEAGTSTGYAAFVTQLRTYFEGASKEYYVSGAPQCPYPDAYLGSVINAADFDMIYVQFCKSQYMSLDNNPCGLQNFNTSSDWDYGIWDYWATNVSPNPDVKIYIGAPASSTASGTGYQDAVTFGSILQTTQMNFPSFGGAMLWDASQAYANNRYDQSSKGYMTTAGTCDQAFQYQTCNAPAYVSGQSYTGGDTVTYQGYVWQAKWWTENTPASDPNGDWSAIMACTGTGTSGTPTTTATTPPTSSAPATGSCAGVAAWDSSSVYTDGDQVTYDGDLWTAQWWTEGDTPGGSAGVWTDNGACTSIAGRMLF